MSGPATLAGTLNIDILAGTPLSASDQYTVMTYGSRVGEGIFDPINVSDLEVGLTLTASYSETFLTLSIVPAGNASATTGPIFVVDRTASAGRPDRFTAGVPLSPAPRSASQRVASLVTSLKTVEEDRPGVALHHDPLPANR